MPNYFTEQELEEFRFHLRRFCGVIGRTRTAPASLVIFARFMDLFRASV